ncbi:MAG: type 4a pilus biogenesis protein PilO [Candidatus Omnitrophica bacterium]|nr:type 4a pilus biogenesis protein PilO [Candidatus Omnitrophota bacterium]
MKKFATLFLNRPAINLTVSILFIVFYLFLFFPPKIKKIFLLLPEVSQLQAKIVTLEKDWTNIDSFKQKISLLNKEIAYYEKRLPAEKEIPAVLEYLSDSAKKLDVRITEIKPVGQSQDEEQIYYSVPILVKAECGYHQLGRFLSELEGADRFMKISDIKLEASSYQINSLDVQLIVVTYVMKK